MSEAQDTDPCCSVCTEIGGPHGVPPWPAAPSEPPAEAQQDDDPCCTIDGGGRCNDCPAPAARPSADTETLLGRVGALADELDLWTLTEESKPNDDVWEDGYRSALRHAAFRIRAALDAR